MQTVYLGLFSSIFKAVYNAILKPIIDFFGGLLNAVFTWVFDNILKPLLINVIFPLFKGLLEMVYEIIAGVFYEILAEILKIVDDIQVVFNVFAGVTPITYDNKQYYLLEFFFSRKEVQYATWIIIAISVVLMLAFSIIAVLRSMADLSGEMKNPVSKVLRLTGEAFLKLMMIPIVCILLIRLSGVILNSVYDGVNTVMNTAPVETDENGNPKETKPGNSQTTLGRTIFCIATLDAAKQSQYNTSTNPATAGIFDGLRAAYYYTDYNGGSGKNFWESSTVERDFQYTKINYIIGFGVGLLFLFIMASTTFKFINRMFNVIVLYILSPFFACSMPVDEGKNYNSWKDMFVGQLFAGYGSVLAMQVYLMLVPSIMSGSIKFLADSTEGDMIVRIVFLVGGGFALLNAGTVITGLISSEAASMESAQGQAFQGAAIFAAKAGMRAAKAVNKALKSGGGSGQGGAGGEGGEGGEGKEGKDGKEGGKEGGTEGGRSKFDGGKGGAAGGGAGAGAKFDGAGGGEGKGGAGGAVAENAKKLADNKAGGAAGGAKPGAAGAGAAKPGAGGPAAGAGGGEGAGDGAQPGAGAGGAKPGAAGGPAAGANGGAGAGDGAQPAAGAGNAANADAQGEGQEGEEGGAGAGGKSGGKKKKSKAGIKRSYFGGLFVTGKDASGKERWGLNLGKHFNFGLRADGSMGGNVFGLASWSKSTGKDDKSSKISLLGGLASWKNDKSGKLDKISIPFVRLKRAQDGKMHVSKVKFTQGMQIRRTEQVLKDASGNVVGRQLGGMYVSDLSAIGMKRRFDADTGNIETLSSLGTHYRREKKSDGTVEYVKAYSNFLGQQKVYERDNAGNYHTVAQKGWLTSESYALDKSTGEKVLMSRVLNNGMSLYKKTEVSFGEGEKEFAPDAEDIKSKSFSAPTGESFTYSTINDKKEEPPTPPVQQPPKPEKNYGMSDLKDAGGQDTGWVDIHEAPKVEEPAKKILDDWVDVDKQLNSNVVNIPEPQANQQQSFDDWVQMGKPEVSTADKADGWVHVDVTEKVPEAPQVNQGPQVE